MRHVRALFSLGLVALLFGMLPAAAPRALAQSAGCKSFAQTGYTICGQFLAYWESRGGLAQQGYPISGEITAVNPLDGKTYTQQIFERAVLEKHPENAPPYDTLLMQLGTLRYKQKYPQGAPGQTPAAGGQWFGQTGHRIGGQFLTYWQQHGGLAQQGYPISDEFTEVSELDGKPYKVQYFERAVFEYHPENAAPNAVLLSQLGTFHARTLPPGTVQAAAPPAPVAAKASFQKGLNFVSWYAGGYASAAADQALAQLAATGANTLAVVVTGYQDTIGSTSIRLDSPRTPTDADLAHVIATAHRLGLRVLLKPHVDLANDPGHWRGQIGQAFSGEGQWQAWFASYRDFIGHYAALAQQNGADLLCVGTELVGTSAREADWRAVISTVRSKYQGQLTYAANWGDDVVSIRWWDAVDYIGVDAYYPLTGKTGPTVDEIARAWVDRGYVGTLEGLAGRFGKQIILTEIGYGSVAGTNRAPYDWQAGGTLDLQEQANAYQAAFAVFWGKPWLAGMYWWSWDADPNTGGAGDKTYTPHNKPAEQVLKSYYSGGGR
ncbi:MAG TPA: hypothetical protein VFM49_15980 [Chloroflexia bacterium]|nr:hypothetical protein [Chloroflexia bacterium]